MLPIKIDFAAASDVVALPFLARSRIAGDNNNAPHDASGDLGDRRSGRLQSAAAALTQYQAWFGAFLQALGQSGWTIGRNVQVDTRWATANADSVRRHATELAALAPDVIVSPGASTVGPLLQVTRTIPIVFAIVADPVGAGFVASLARPGGNATGFMLSNTVSAGNGWSCSSRSHRALRGWRSFAIPPYPPEPASSASYRRWRRRSV